MLAQFNATEKARQRDADYAAAQNHFAAQHVRHEHSCAAGNQEITGLTNLNQDLIAQVNKLRDETMRANARELELGRQLAFSNNTLIEQQGMLTTMQAANAPAPHDIGNIIQEATPYQYGVFGSSCQEPAALATGVNPNGAALGVAIGDDDDPPTMMMVRVRAMMEACVNWLYDDDIMSLF